MFSGRPSRHYLSAVPIGLLPLLPDGGETTDTDESAGSSLAGSPLEVSRTGSPVPGPNHNTHQGHGFGYGYHPAPERAPVSPWSMNFHRSSPPVSAQPSSSSSSYFPAVPSPPPSSPALGGPNTTRPAFCYSTTTTSSLYMTATPAPTIHAPTALSYSLSTTSSSTASSTSTSPTSPTGRAGGLAHLSHLLPVRPKPQRVRPRFAFLPLLETPPSSAPSSALSSIAPSRAESPVPESADTAAFTPISADAATTTNTMAIDEYGPAGEGETTPTDPDAEHEFPRALRDDCSASSEAETDTDGAPSTPALTNASLDSSPRSRASSLEPGEGDLVHIARAQVHLGALAPEREKARARSVERRFAGGVGGADPQRRRPASVSRERGAVEAHGYGWRHDARGYASAGASREVSRERTQVSAATMFSGGRFAHAAPSLPSLPSPPVEAKPRTKKRNFIVVNDMEIELDDDDDEEEKAQMPADTALSETRMPSCALSEDAQEGMATPHASPVRA